MRINTREIMDGLHDGKTVWITHYNKPDPNKKPLRNITPAEVRIMSNQEVEATKRPVDESGNMTGRARKPVYYSYSHFAPYGKGGKLLKKVISPVDNTGYRMRSGNKLNVFTTKEEAQESYCTEYESFHPKPTHVSVEISRLMEVVTLLADEHFGWERGELSVRLADEIAYFKELMNEG